MAEQRELIAGADHHADTIHIAAIAVAGQPVGDREFPTTPAGYRAAIQFLTGLGQIRLAGIEGTCSYGAGLTRTMLAAGIEAEIGQGMIAPHACGAKAV